MIPSRSYLRSLLVSAIAFLLSVNVGLLAVDAFRQWVLLLLPFVLFPLFVEHYGLPGARSVICPECGTTRPGGVLRCNNCGHWFEESEDGTARTVLLDIPLLTSGIYLGLFALMLGIQRFVVQGYNPVLWIVYAIAMPLGIVYGAWIFGVPYFFLYGVGYAVIRFVVRKTLGRRSNAERS